MLALVMSPALADAEQHAKESSADALLGVWTFETGFGGFLEGELTVAREESAWRATISGAESRFAGPDGDLRCAFPGDLGGFRGALAARGDEIEGFWIRPGVTADPRYPGGSSQAFATPLVLHRAGHDVWRGEVRPLPDRMALYLRISRRDDGALIAAFRDPDQNSNGGAMQFRVTSEGERISFEGQPYPGAPEVQHPARLRADGALEIFWSDLDRTITMIRRSPTEAAAFFPRPLEAAPYTYTQPAATDDGWATARASEVGFDESSLTRLVQRLAGADPAERRPSLIHSLLVARRGKLVLDEYFFGFDREQPHDLRSAGKTFASVMLGAAMMHGARITPETRIYDLLAGRGPFANPDPRKAQITLAHVMTHTAGLACDDNDDASPGNENMMQTQRGQPDWWKYTLDLPLRHDPGVRYGYCSANMNLMGAALTTATATWLPQLFERTVARPLQFGPYHWNLMPTDEGYLGGGAWLRPRDLLKIGQAYLDGGVWRGRRIVDADWIAKSTAPRIEISPATTGLDPEQFSNAYIPAEDAYAWHLGVIHSGKRAYHHYSASGNGGQLLIVVPELELAVVFTGGNYRQGGTWLRWPDDIVGAEIIAALGERP